MFSPFQKKKNVLETQPEPEKKPGNEPMEAAEETAERPGLKEASPEEPGGSAFSNRGQLDKKSLDLIFAVEQILQAKQHAETGRYETQDRLNQANANIDRLTRDLKNLSKVVEEREKRILELEHSLAEKNMKVDQILEDFQELRTSLSGQMEELKGVLELERQKYASLLQKHQETQNEKNKRIGELEEKIVKLEAEGSHLRMKLEEQRQEKAYLVSMVNDFTSRMASPFQPLAGGKESSSD